MKIKTKINNDTLIALDKYLNQVYQILPVQGIGKVWISIGMDLADTFNKKVRTIQKQSSIFDVKKKHNISLKYHEAWALKELLITLLQYIKKENDLHYVLLQKLFSELDQKLI